MFKFYANRLNHSRYSTNFIYETRPAQIKSFKPKLLTREFSSAFRQ
jgi:hypothetical protein